MPQAAQVIQLADRRRKPEPRPFFELNPADFHVANDVFEQRYLPYARFAVRVVNTPWDDVLLSMTGIGAGPASKMRDDLSRSAENLMSLAGVLLEASHRVAVAAGIDRPEAG